MPTRAESEARRDHARVLFAAGAPKRAIARHLGVATTTVRRYLKDEPEVRRSTARLPRAIALDAWLNFRARAGRKPTSSDWNATRAWLAGADAARLYAEGYVSKIDGQFRAWPDPSRDVPQGWKAFEREGGMLAARLDAIGLPFRPPPLPITQRGLAYWSSYARATRDGRRPRVLDEDLSRAWGEPISPLATTRGPAWRPLRSLDGVALVGAPRSGKTTWLRGAAALDAARGERVVVLERGTPIPAQAPLSELLEAAAGEPVFVAGDVGVRTRAVEEAAAIANRSDTPLLLFVDDADDVLQALVLALVCRPSRRLFVAAAWEFSPMPWDLAVFGMLLSRMVLTPHQDALRVMPDLLRRGRIVHGTEDDPDDLQLTEIDLDTNVFLGRICLPS